MSESLRRYGLQSTRLFCPLDSTGKNTGAGCHALLQRIFLNQGSNLHLLRLLCCRWILYPDPLGKPLHISTSPQYFEKSLVQGLWSTEQWLWTSCSKYLRKPSPSEAHWKKNPNIFSYSFLIKWNIVIWLDSDELQGNLPICVKLKNNWKAYLQCPKL